MRTRSGYSALFISCIILFTFFIHGSLRADDKKKAVDTNAGGALNMYVLFKKNEFPDWKKVLEDFKARWPEKKEVELFPTEQGLSFHVGKKLFLSMSVSQQPVQHSVLNTALPGSWWWPSAARDLINQTGFVFILVAPLDRDFIKANKVLTTLSSVLLQSPNSIGVYLASSNLVMQKERYLADAAKMTDEKLPINLWVKTRVWNEKGNAKSKTAMAATNGLNSFGLMEIEANEAPSDLKHLYSVVSGLASYLVKKGDVVKDGQIIGLSKDDKIKVLHRSSVFGAKDKVYLLEFPKAATN